MEYKAVLGGPNWKRLRGHELAGNDHVNPTLREAVDEFSEQFIICLLLSIMCNSEREDGLLQWKHSEILRITHGIIAGSSLLARCTAIIYSVSPMVRLSSGQAWSIERVKAFCF